MTRYVCIHGHFYQPPRENPWLEAVEPQDSAAPYHDWNERVTAECYEPNGAARILDDEERIVRIVNNYSRISFNFGPSLLSWMESAAPLVYEAVLGADAESKKRFGGHGSAIAQAYNHSILPLAPAWEKRLQIHWGIVDFRHRFERDPEGMWLPETAVDLETLAILQDEGIRYTILAPSQAARVRTSAHAEWREVDGQHIDPRQPYVQQLPSGESIVLFFYDGPVSRAVAFEGLLHRGERFAKRLLELFSNEDVPQLAHIATDGESYGHHHPHGDMALAFALAAIEESEHAELTNYGQYLELHPPSAEVQVLERTSWSCAHGVERWRSDCGCHTGGPPEWNQAWRAPLREALDSLRERLLVLHDEEASGLLKDPGAALRDYIEVILDRSPANTDDFLDRHLLTSGAVDRDRERALKLLEMRRQLMLMYTSCGWFFSDLAGIETVQVLRYAGRAIQLGEDLFDADITAPFLAELARATSNRAEAGSGDRLFQKKVTPAVATWEDIAAHYSILMLFDGHPERSTVYCYDVEREELESRSSGKGRLVMSRVRLTTRITRSSSQLSFAVLHLGDHNVVSGVRRFESRAEDEQSAERIREAFLKGDLTATMQLIERESGGRTYNLGSLFGNEQRVILERLLESTVKEAEEAHRHLHRDHGATMRFLTSLGVPLPKALSAAAELVLNDTLRNALGNTATDLQLVRDLLQSATMEGIQLDEASLAYHARRSLEQVAALFFENPDDTEVLSHLQDKLTALSELPFEVDVWKVQNGYYRSWKAGRIGKDDALVALGKALSMKLE